MIRNKTNSYFHFIKTEDNRLDFDYNHPYFDELETLNQLTNYEVVDLGDIIVNIVSGKTPRNMKYLEDGINFLGAGNISEQGINFEEIKKIDKSFHENELNSSQLKKGDILITIAGTIGRAALFEKDMEANINQAIAKIELKKEVVNSEYLVKYLNSYFGELNFKKQQHEVSQPNINLEEVKKIKIILPPLLKQQEIIKEIKIIENKSKEYKNSINIKKIIDNIFLEKYNLNKNFEEFCLFKIDKTHTYSFFNFLDNKSMNRLDFSYYQHDKILDIIKKEGHILLKDICEKDICSGKQPQYSESGKRVIKTVDMKENYIEFDNTLFVSEEFFNENPKAHAKKGDLIITGTGFGSIGKVNIFNIDEVSLVDPQLLIVSINETYSPEFIKYFLNSVLGQIQFDKYSSGSSGQLHIYPKDLNNFIIPKISSEEQMMIVSIINEKYRICEKNYKKYKFYWKESKEQFKNLITKL